MRTHTHTGHRSCYTRGLTAGFERKSILERRQATEVSPAGFVLPAPFGKAAVVVAVAAATAAILLGS